MNITTASRHQIADTVRAIRQMQAAAALPPPTTDTRRCKGCSLRDRCQPEALARLRSSGALPNLFDPEA